MTQYTEEQLRATLAEIEKDCCSPWEAETVQDLARQCLDLMAREHAALARAEAAEALLRPFAEEEKTWSRSVADDYRPGILEPNQRTALAKAEFSIGDLRRAAAHLATVPQQSSPAPEASVSGAEDQRFSNALRVLRQSYVTLAFAFNRLHESSRSRDGELCLDFQKVRAQIEVFFKEHEVKL